MKFKSLILMLVLCGLSDTAVFSQDKYIDSLKLVLLTAKEDTSKVNTLNSLSWQLWARPQNFDTALTYATEALQLSQELAFKKGIAYSYFNIAQSIQNQTPESLKNYYLALKLFEELGNKEMTGTTLQSIGATYSESRNVSEAIKYLEKALDVRLEMGNKSHIAQTLTSLGDCYRAQGKLDLALQKLQAAYNSYKEMGDAAPGWGVPFSLANIAMVYEFQGKFSESIKCILECIPLWEKIGMKQSIATAELSLGRIYMKLENFEKAKYHLKRCSIISRDSKINRILMLSFLYFSQVNSMEGNYKQALDNYEHYILYKDSLDNQESRNKSESYKMKYEVEKKEDEIKLLTTENKLKTTLASKEKQQKYFAYIGIAAILLAGSYGFYRYRRKKKLQGQQAVLSERLRISSELHDEVGATLSGIAMYSHLTKEQMKTGQTAEIEKSLNVMQQSSAQMVDKLNDIVWLINPEQDSLQKLIERLEEYARDMAAIKNMQVKITLPDKIAELNLPIENRRNIYLFCKEAINNAVKYSNGDLLELTVKEVDNKLEFSVSDNGKGFDAVMVRRGNGLENMQKRADEIGAKLSLQSKQNEGASVSLQCNTT